VDHPVYTAVHAMITEQIRACDGHDLSASVAYLLLCCDAMGELSQDIHSHFSEMSAYDDADDTDDDDGEDGEDDDDDDDDNDADDTEANEAQLVVPTLGDFEREQVGQMVLPFAGVAEHFAALDMARARAGFPPLLSAIQSPRRFPRFVPPGFPGRSTVSSNVNPDVLVVYRGVTVSHTYKYDDGPDDDSEEWDNQRLNYWYQVDGSQFDVRGLPEWSDEGDRHIDVICSAIDMGIDLRRVGL
jgi:hypothetical protein